MNDWFDAEQRIERAQQLSESMRWAEALAEMEAALAINPNNGSWHAQRGYLLEELDRPSEAISAYEYALELEPDDRDVMMALGAGLLRLGRIARALNIFELFFSKTYPDFEPAYCHRIAAYAELGRHDQAEQMFYIAQELDDSCPHCFFNIAESLAVRGEMERAIYCWQRVLELEPNYIGVNRRIAQAFRAAGSWTWPAYFLRDLREDPGNVDLLFELAELALESGQLAQAASKFSHIVELCEDHIEARFALGKIWLAQRQAREALGCFEAIEAIETEGPTLPEFDRRVAEALFQLGRHREANLRFEIAVEHDPNNADLLMTYGNCLISERKIRQAEDCYRRVLALDDDYAQAHHSLAVCLFQRDRFDLGLQHCLKAIELNPDSVPSCCNAGVAYMRLGQWSHARTMLGKAAELDPKNALVSGLLRRMWRYRLAHLWRGLRRVFRRNG